MTQAWVGVVVLYCTVLYTVLHCTVLYCTVCVTRAWVGVVCALTAAHAGRVVGCNRERVRSVDRGANTLTPHTLYPARTLLCHPTQTVDHMALAPEILQILL